MSKAGETFFTTIGCMDGRVQEPILKMGQKNFGAKFADTITEAGLVGDLSKQNVDDNLIKSLKKKIMISLQKHHSKGIIVHGHQECAGNVVSDQRHKKDVRKSVDMVKFLVNPSVPVVGVFVKRSQIEPSNWEVEEISPTLTV